MPDSVDDELEELKRRAIALRQEGIRSKEISKILKSGHSAWVIQKWLRDAGAIPDIQDRVLNLSPQKKTHEVATILKLSERRVQCILKEAGISQRQRNTTEQNVDLFLSNPERYTKARFTQSGPFGWALLRRGATEVEKNPVKGLQVVEVTKQLLDRIRRTRRKGWTNRQALCLYVQSQGSEARVYQLKNRHEVAERALQTALSESVGCIPCEAAHLRRLGVLYGSWKKWEQAHSSWQGAVERYRAIGDAGHDLLGNGMANCMLLSSGLYYFTVSPQAGAAEARKGLAILTGKESSVLLRNLVFALAKCLQASMNPSDIAQSRELLEWCFDTLDVAGECCVARTMLYWLRGHLASVDGTRDEAIEYLTLALEDAHELELEQEVSAILADIGTLNPDPREIRNYIEDLYDWTDDGDLIVPAWYGKLQLEIQSIYDLSLSSRGNIDSSVFLKLREAAKGETLMPPLITPFKAANPTQTLFPAYP